VGLHKPVQANPTWGKNTAAWDQVMGASEGTGSGFRGIKLPASGRNEKAKKGDVREKRSST